WCFCQNIVVILLHALYCFYVIPETICTYPRVRYREISPDADTAKGNNGQMGEILRYQVVAKIRPRSSNEKKQQHFFRVCPFWHITGVYSC
ncbi:MAG: hypothetical protein E7A34_14265, partial [Leclercia adecarboxylata]|nr:hypothetical protein [Leclercia adecarboxylata]